MSSSHSNHRPNERRPRPFALPSLVAAGLAALVLACNPSETKSTTPGAAPISAPSFDGNRLLGILDALASDALGGRYTLHDDIREAAAVITSRYETAGVVPGTEDGFLLEYDLVVGIDPEPGTTLTLGDDQVPATALIPRPEGAVGDAAGPLVFVGYGITRVGFDELAEVYIDGAVAVMLANAPPSTDEAGTKPRRPPRLARRLDGLAKAGAVAVVLVDDPLAVRPTTGRELPPLPDTTEDHPLRRRVDIPVVQVDTPTADALIGAKGVPALSDLQAKLDEVQQPQSRAITGVRARVTTQFTPRTVQAPNILAIVPGTDLADEIVLLGAHYDHIGTDAPGHGHCEATPSIEGSPDAICNGADD
ncbi:MAG: hypothetical protein K0V04_14000, partial [Deltaproteobacteria bacterium]|nr:hypothetical protein [Deltaproteobacteria bacterium]